MDDTEFLATELGSKSLIDIPGLEKHAFPPSCRCLSQEDAISVLIGKGLARRQGSHMEWICDWFYLEQCDSLATAEKAFTKSLIKVSQALSSAPGVNGRLWHHGIAPLTGPPGVERKSGTICLVSVDQNPKWEDVLATVQLVSNPDDLKSALKQLHTDACLVFSSQYRRFFVGMTICHYEVRFHLFDRSGANTGLPFDLRKEPTHFLQLISAFIFAPYSWLGFDPTMTYSGGKPTVIVVNEAKYMVLDCIYCSPNIYGRGTWCWSVEKEGDPSVKRVIKDSWVDESRRNIEVHVLTLLKGTEGVPVLIDDIIVENKIDDRFTTASIRRLVKSEQLRNIERRIHTRIVTSPLAQDLTRFTSKHELLLVFADAVSVLAELAKRKVLHRDVSLGNIMIRDTEHGSPKALLIDYDNAIALEDRLSLPEPAIGHQTGTLPFMAITAMLGKAHTASNDLESLFYVLVWVCVHYNGPNHTRRRKDELQYSGLSPVPLHNWNDHTQPLSIVAATKTLWFEDAHRFSEWTLQMIAPYFEDLKPCLVELQSIVFNRTTPRNISHDAMIQVLQKHAENLPRDNSMPAARSDHLPNNTTNDAESDDNAEEAEMSM